MEMNTKVKITNLGRENFSGEFTYTGTREEVIKQIEFEVRKHLVSSNISTSKPLLSTGKTKIYAGFRPVGEIQIWRTTHK